MNPWYITAIIIALALSTLITRGSFWFAGKHIHLPKRIQDALRFAPVCALAAIMAPDLLLNQGHIHLEWTNIKLMAGLLATAFYFWKRNMLMTILVGMGAFTLLRVCA